ncbi:MAG: transposase [Planctomycetota bacterium]
MRYSKEFKERMVRRLVGPSAQSAMSLARETGVSQATLSRWLRDSLGGVSDNKASWRDSRDPMELAELVFEANKLEGEAYGAFLRKHGLHHSDLEEMRAWLRQRLDPSVARKEKAQAAKSKRADAKTIKKLRREIDKKDKALAEAAAILVFQKKVRALWGDEDDDTEPKNDDR